MLLDLSVELLELIGAQLTHCDLAILRTVCKALNGVLCRSFFFILVLKTNRNGLSQQRVDLLKALATRETGWSAHAKTLRIVPAKQLSLKRVSDNTLVPLLAAALASLPKIHTVVWHVANQDHWAWERTAVLAFLATLGDTLHELELSIPNTINLSALQIRGLRKFTFKCPGYGPSSASLVGLGLSSTPMLPLMYDDIAALISGNQLTSLHFEGTTEWSVIWRLMRSRKDGTKLIEITTSIVTQDLFDYLSSYSGLEKLALMLSDGSNQTVSNHLADAFFETVLPRHAETLRELSCPSAYQSGFSFGPHNVHVVSSLHKLTRLEMSINAAAVQSVHSYGLTMLPILVGGGGLPVLTEADQDDLDLVVTLLLETAAGFPFLQTLIIRAAETEENRSAGYWYVLHHPRNPINHTNAVNVAIGNAVEAFCTDVLCSATVYAGHATYRLLPRGVLGPTCAVAEAQATPRGCLRYVQTGWWSPCPL
ncbi:F-box domain-containing protein [Mycena sanguinolenta]|uniref:F-box domain-containing protein n=1 Tax=Mycena sanguinolenta TaxID=230812 RepID=A0A8H6Y4Q9_9AGAR|nr:F-box domain-containing protein [Mycena sanguinolenta]